MNLKERVKMALHKKGNMGMLEGVILSLIVIGFLIIIGLSLMSKARDTQITGETGCTATNTTLCGSAYNASGEVLDAMNDIPGWLPVIVLAFIAVVVLGVVYVLRRFNR